LPIGAETLVPRGRRGAIATIKGIAERETTVRKILETTLKKRGESARKKGVSQWRRVNQTEENLYVRGKGRYLDYVKRARRGESWVQDRTSLTGGERVYCQASPGRHDGKEEEWGRS